MAERLTPDICVIGAGSGGLSVAAGRTTRIKLGMSVMVLPGRNPVILAKALASLETDVALYLENTAGGDHAMARHFDVIARLWDHIGDKGIGFCLDTCHAWAAGEKLVDAVERIMSITGRIDLVHCNDSRDAAGSGADRHANFGTGQIDPDLLVAVVTAAGAPVICETADEGRKDDIAFLREHVG